MLNIKNSQTANDGCSKQSNFNYMTVVLLWKYCNHQKFLLDKTVSSQLKINIFINIHRVYTHKLKFKLK